MHGFAEDGADGGKLEHVAFGVEHGAFGVPWAGGFNADNESFVGGAGFYLLNFSGVGAVQRIGKA